MPELIDTHCHLTHGRLGGNLPAVLDRARKAGLVAFICASGNLEESQAGSRLAEIHRDVFFIAGQHPHDAKSAGDDYLKRIEALVGRAGCVGIGEVGLDYHYDYSPRPVQREVFAAQLSLARHLRKPVVVHVRESFEESVAILSESGVDGGLVLFHSFAAGPAQVRRALDLGAMISLSGIATFKTASSVQQAAKLIPVDRLMIETDSPYLSPEPVRHLKTNEPANVEHVGRFVARLRGESFDSLAELTTRNARRFFNLSLQPQP